MFAQQRERSVDVIQYFPSIKLFADMKMGAHVTHQVFVDCKSTRMAADKR